VGDGPPAHDDHGQALAVATRLHATGDSTGALELLPDLVAARPDDGAVRLLLARCLATAGTPAVALAAADAAVACDPTSWAAQAVLAQAALAIDPERATAAAERAVALAPHEPEAHRVMAAVGAALAESSDPDGATRRSTGARGAALGRRPSTTTPAATALDEPRLAPRLPASLAGVVPEGSAADDAPPVTAPPTPATVIPGAPAGPPTAWPTPGTEAPAGPPAAWPTPAAEVPASLAPPVGPSPSVAPPAIAPVQSPAPASAPADGPGATRTEARREPLLPKALGGTGLAGSALAEDPSEEDRIGGGRLAVRVVGLATWLLVGFRLGVQVIGGPAGIALFVGVVAWVAFLARRLTQR
jgi:tetratricopeptide (TPR) repeat protein